MTKWTIILIVSAENNLINESVKAIEEIYKAGYNKEVTFLIIFDGLEYGKFSKEFAKPTLYKVNNQNGFFIEKSVHVSRSENLSDPATLKEIFKHITDRYKSEHYGLIYKGHGASGKTDIGNGNFIEKLFKIPESLIGNDDGIQEYLDEKLKGVDGFYEYRGFARNKADLQWVMAVIKTTGINGKALTYQNIADIVKSSFKDKLAFVCLDCCWGMQIENAYTFSAVTDHFVASADQTPALGLGYQELCTRINERPNIRPEEIARMMVAVFFFRNYSDYDSTQEGYDKMGVSYTYLNTETMAATGDGKSFEEKMKALCDYLIANMNKFVQVIYMARKKCKDYTYTDTETLAVGEIQYAVFNIDLPWFLSNLKYFNKEADSTLDKLITDLQLIISNDLIAAYLCSNYKKPLLGGSTAYEGGNGVTIIFPVSNTHAVDTDSLFKSETLPFYKKTNWLKFLKAYYLVRNDKSKSLDHTELFNSYHLKSFSPSFFTDWNVNKDTKGIEQGASNKAYIEMLDQQGEPESESAWGKIILKKP